MAGAMEAASKGKKIMKVAPFVLALLRRPPLKILPNLAEGLIKGTCEHKPLLAKQLVDNWNQGYQ